jgi:hypothetical protein
MFLRAFAVFGSVGTNGSSRASVDKSVREMGCSTVPCAAPIDAGMSIKNTVWSEFSNIRCPPWEFSMTLSDILFVISDYKDRAVFLSGLFKIFVRDELR